MEKHYKLLGLEITATLEEVEKKYKKLLKEFDPKKQSDDDLKEFFKSEQEKIKKAYDIIVKHLSEETSEEDDIINESEIHDLGVSQGSEKTKFCKFCGHMQYVTNSECVNCRESLISFDYKSSNKKIVSTGHNKRMFSSPFSFNGRIRRLEYGLSCIIFCIYFNLIQSHYYNYYYDFTLQEFILLLPFVWFFIAQGAKRCHDCGNSGWMQLVPFYNPLALIFTDGEIGDNEYGSNPKGLNSN